MGCISLTARRDLIGISSAGTMYLAQPAWFTGQGRSLNQATSIFRHCVGLIAHVIAKIEGVVGRQAHPTGACGGIGMYVGRGWPIGRDQFESQFRCEVAINES